MADEPENLTLKLLREMREENAAFRAEVNARFDRLDDRFDKTDAKLGALGAKIDSLLDLATGARAQLAEFLKARHG